MTIKAQNKEFYYYTFLDFFVDTSVPSGTYSTFQFFLQNCFYKTTHSQINHEKRYIFRKIDNNTNKKISLDFEGGNFLDGMETCSRYKISDVIFGFLSKHNDGYSLDIFVADINREKIYSVQNVVFDDNNYHNVLNNLALQLAEKIFERHSLDGCVFETMPLELNTSYDVAVYDKTGAWYGTGLLIQNSDTTFVRIKKNKYGLIKSDKKEYLYMTPRNTNIPHLYVR